MLRRTIISLYLVSEALVLAAQSNYRTPVVTPSPSSAVFSLYGNNQPMLPTGTVNIPIPLFNIKASGIEIPLNVSYQTAGINIMDSPYPTGYGWVFSSGFRVTRTVLGRPDERFRFRESTTGDGYDTLKLGILDVNYISYQQVTYDQLFDTQKDIFTLHLPSGSHKFFIKKVGASYEPILIGTKIKIEILINSVAALEGFKVTDESGIVFLFGYNSSTSYLNYAEFPSGTGGTTAWTLREIQLLNGEKLTFTWKSVNINDYAARVAEPISVFDYKNFRCTMEEALWDFVPSAGIISYDSYTYVLMLEKIVYPGGEVNLTYKSSADPFLKKLEAKNMKGDIVKTADFTYGIPGAEQQHLLLKSLKVDEELYSFQYNDYYFGKSSTSLDYWGYYNAKSNTTVIPKMDLQVYSGRTWGSVLSPNTPTGPIGDADRSVSANHMKAFMLKRINFPAGGYSDYEYESHQFPGQDVNSTGLFTFTIPPLTQGGGLRVSQITSYTSSSASPTVRTYKYGVNEDGLANIAVAPTLDTFIDEYWQARAVPQPSCEFNFAFATNRLMNLNALSNYTKFLIDQNPIWYSEVAEYVNEFKTEYNFEFSNDGISWEVNALRVKNPFVHSHVNFFSNGPRLAKTTVFKKEGVAYLPVKSTINEYELILFPFYGLSNIIIDRNVLFDLGSLPGPDFYSPPIYIFYPGSWFTVPIEYRTYPYSILPQYRRLKKTTIKSYFGTDSVSNVEEYFYNDSQLVKVVKQSSVSGQDISVEYTYPNDLTDPIYVNMTGKNIVSPVIEEKTSKGSSVIKRITTNYTDSSPITTGLILPSSVEASYSASGPFITEITYEKYDSQGNVRQISPLNGIKISYLWSYRGQYPVAEIRNAEIGDVVTALGGQTAVDNFRNDDNPDVEGFLSGLRTAFPEALITTYTYFPLVGMTGTTDPKGLKTTYEYDSFRRLMNIKDHNGDIVKSYQYHYKL